VPDWFRNADWNADIEAAFEAKLARCRSQGTQYLRIQGSTLKDSHPAVAIQLLARCIDAGDPMFVAHALLDTAHAQYRLGEVDAALDTLEALLDQQRREPRFRTSVEFDYPFLVAVHGRAERYYRALHLLTEQGDALFPGMEFEQAAAWAIISSERGDQQLGAEAAKLALLSCEQQGWIPGFPGVGTVPVTEHPLFERLRDIAAQAG
jgi:hypothetical protein